MEAHDKGWTFCVDYSPAKVKHAVLARNIKSSIGSFPKFNHRYNWIIICTDYYSRFTWANTTKRNDSDTITTFIQRIFETFGVPVGIYLDPRPHFGSKSKQFAQENSVVQCHACVRAKRAVGLIEKSVDILQRALKKVTPEPES